VRTIAFPLFGNQTHRGKRQSDRLSSVIALRSDWAQNRASRKFGRVELNANE
jgi:hypothetical protein